MIIMVKIMVKIMAKIMVKIIMKIMMIIMVRIMLKTIRLLSAVSKRPRLMPKMVTKTRSTGKELA